MKFVEKSEILLRESEKMCEIGSVQSLEAPTGKGEVGIIAPMCKHCNCVLPLGYIGIPKDGKFHFKCNMTKIWHKDLTNVTSPISGEGRLPRKKTGIARSYFPFSSEAASNYDVILEVRNHRTADSLSPLCFLLKSLYIILEIFLKFSVFYFFSRYHLISA